jgi:hypothetical protein
MFDVASFRFHNTHLVTRIVQCLFLAVHQLSPISYEIKLERDVPED